jgi:hypothetical protein
MTYEQRIRERCKKKAWRWLKQYKPEGTNV